jgi:hypothetical protein
MKLSPAVAASCHRNLPRSPRAAFTKSILLLADEVIE